MRSAFVFAVIILSSCAPTRYVVPLLKREKAFTDILEGIHPSEVELLLQVKDKKLKCRGLTFNLVKETFPNLLPWL